MKNSYDKYYYDKNRYLNETEYNIEDNSQYSEEADRPPSPLSSIPRRKYLALPVFLFILFFVFTHFSTSYPAGSLLWVSGEKVFIEKELWRLISAIFVHADIKHILSNAPLFIIFGWFLFSYFGFKIFPFASLLIGVLTNLIAIMSYDPSIRLIGASGMVYGMAGQWLVLYVFFDTGHTVPKRIFRSIGFSMAMLFPTTFQTNVSYISHAAGFFLGLVISLLMIKSVKVREK